MDENIVGEVVNPVLTAEAIEAAAEERKQAKLAKQAAKRARREAQQAASTQAVADPALLGEPFGQHFVDEKPAKMVPVTLAEAKELVIPEIPIELPDELKSLENDPAFIAKQKAADLREQAFQQLDMRNGMREELAKLEKEIDGKRRVYSGLHRRFMDKYLESNPGVRSWINSSEPTSVAHREAVGRFIDLAIAKVDESVAKYLDAKKQLAEVSLWLQEHGNDHLGLFHKAEEVCREAGLDYRKIWPQKEKGNAGA